MIFGEIESFVSLLERVIKPLKQHKVIKNNDLISTRLVEICEAHGVHRNQIPKILGSGLALYDVKNDSTLLKKLDDDILNKAAELLGVNRDWLDGASNEIYPTYDFYKDSEGFQEFLTNKLNSGFELDGVLLTPTKNYKYHGALLLLQEKIGELNGNPYYRYYLCNNWRHNYWKSRVYLTTCISMCWLNKIYIRGLSVTPSYLESLANGTTLLNFKNDGIFNINGKSWYAEDMALLPDIFLKDLDPEYQKFGIKAGLSFWLEMHSLGFMNCGIENNDARLRFLKELEKYA
ncbi:hypothetical protein QWZ04_02995 [Vibrio tapetis subsp. quintayensis]|uniref:hypothetical protein n=1 Tax=Vibrio tapetis TaxID=52443 RepID=UPI0025B42227|nr:hypothetical protein [Vibrio tapetis]MDN3679294.1 hypothetical protein [Vibrio tapetis subsp. quintayensis]